MLPSTDFQLRRRLRRQWRHRDQHLLVQDPPQEGVRQRRLRQETRLQPARDRMQGRHRQVSTQIRRYLSMLLIFSNLSGFELQRKKNPRRQMDSGGGFV